ncbi:MAG: ferritin family protein [FCB group bacterium]|nr:ferritin family protein [FCB group bacterium]
MKLNTIEEILDFAIEQEQLASDFYTDLAGRMDKPNMKKVFEDFAQEEQGHKKKLLSVKTGKFSMPTRQKVQDLGIGDHLVQVELTADIDFQDALILAMKAEKAAFKLYAQLAEAADDEKAKALFQSLAQEEARHKLRFEIEYDDFAYQEN